MTTAPIPFRDRFIRTGRKARRQRLVAIALLLGAAVVGSSVYVFTSVLVSTPSAPLLAGFHQRSYRPGQVAPLWIGDGVTNRAKLQIFLAGAAGGDAKVAAKPGWDKHTFGEA